MKLRRIPILLALLTLCVGLLYFNFSSPFSSQRESVIGDLNASPENVKMRPVTTQEARRISPVGWTAPQVFSKTMGPVEIREVERGANLSRRFWDPSPQIKVLSAQTKGVGVFAGMPEDGRTYLEPEEIDLYTKEARRLSLNTEALEGAARGEIAQLTMPSTSQETFEVQLQSQHSRDPHTHTFQGKILGEESSSEVQIVYHDGVVHGNIVRYDRQQEFEYRILPDGYLMVREIAVSEIDGRCGGSIEALEDVTGRASEVQDSSPVGFPDRTQARASLRAVDADQVGQFHLVDVVVGYGKTAKQSDGGAPQIEARIIGSVDRMNLAFENSQIDNGRIVLLGTIEDPDYVFGGTISSTMRDEVLALEDGSDGSLDVVSDYRESLGADLACFVVDRGQQGILGSATRPGRASAVSRSTMIGTTITFGHELGHNLGCNHSWGDSSSDYGNHRHYGWRFKPENSPGVRTIMAYDFAWGSGNVIPYFANPNVRYDGARTGASPGYDITGDATADQRYLVGGFSGGSARGYDGSNANLGAMAYLTIKNGSGRPDAGLPVASQHAVRKVPSIIGPDDGERIEHYSFQVIGFGGSVSATAAQIELLRNGNLVRTLFDDLNPALGIYESWIVPDDLAPASGYSLRITLTGGANDEVVQGPRFEIVRGSTRVTQITPDGQTVLRSALSKFDFVFNHPIDPSSFSIADDVLTFQGPGGVDLRSSISAVTWSGGNQFLSLTVGPHFDAGDYLIELGPNIFNALGVALDQDEDLKPGEQVQDRISLTVSSLTRTAALDAPSLRWTPRNEAYWEPQTEITQDGNHALYSGVGSSRRFYRSIDTVAQGPATLTYWQRLRIGPFLPQNSDDIDYFRTYLNGEEVEELAATGHIDWEQKTLILPPGTHTIRWSYEPDGVLDIDEEGVWLDQFEYIPQSAEAVYNNWSAQSHTGAFSNTGPLENPDNDEFVNLIEFAFGLDPTRSSAEVTRLDSEQSLVSVGIPTIIGIPAAPSLANPHVVFSRRLDYGVAGLEYIVEFSADLVRWSNANSDPSVLANNSGNSEVEAVSVAFPNSVPTDGGGSASPKFFRIRVAQD